MIDNLQSGNNMETREQFHKQENFTDGFFYCRKMNYLNSLSVLTAFLSVLLHCQYASCDKEEIKNYASIDDPFRMQKCNLLWNKARTKLSEKKLETLFSALKLQDKNELTLKKLKSEGGDKDGSKENEVRKKFNSIMISFGLGGTQESVDNSDNNEAASSKTLFRDKKLQRLWDKAEQVTNHSLVFTDVNQSQLRTHYN